MAEFNTDMYPSGMLWLYGRRPGTESPYEGAFYRNVTLNFLSYTTTEDAIKKVLPPPLEPIPDTPPVIFAWSGHARYHRGWNGKQHHYVELGFYLPCKYKNYKGLTNAFTYLDSPTGDKTEGGELGAIAGRELTGWMKRIGNVKHAGSGDQFHGTVDVRGIRLMTMDLEFTEDVSLEEMPTAGLEYFLFVKEIPNCDFTGYDVRKVIGSKVDFFKNPFFLRKGAGTLQLGHLDTDPVDILKVVEIGPAYQTSFDILLEEGFAGAFEIDNLL
jgi:acetoacetate decarboxylase